MQHESMSLSLLAIAAQWLCAFLYKTHSVSIVNKSCGILLAVLLAACNKEVDYINSIDPIGNTNIVELDSLTAIGDVYVPDSLSTSAGLSYFKMGYLQDTVYGHVLCEPVFRMTVPAELPELTNNSIFDSVALIIKPDRSHAGDTSVPIQLAVYRLAEDMQATNSVFYAHHRFATDAQPLGTSSFLYMPYRKDNDSVRVVLAQAFGESLFDMLRKKNISTTDVSSFQSWLKGFAVRTLSANSNLMLEVPKTDSAIVLRLYYHNDVGRPDKQEVSFPLSASVYGYYAMHINRTAAVLSGLQQKTIATAPRQQLFHQTMTELNTRFSFPALKEMLKNMAGAQIINATLQLKPIQSNLVQHALPATLNLYYYHTDGYLEGPLKDANDATQTGSLQLDVLYEKNSQYSFDITAYIKQELLSNSFTTKRLMIKAGGAGDALQQLSMGMPGNTQYTSRLILTYVSYNNN